MEHRNPQPITSRQVREAVRTADWKYARFFKPGTQGLPKGFYEYMPDFRGRKPDYEQLFDRTRSGTLIAVLPAYASRHRSA